ncbi:hypothetical protein JQ557_18600 [Bradyrhizobium sp. U87765 SZCCT0131]|uniref:hypothetical protein n=1 Tax=unclassified Bradyrhizobium TaxID=2631580 RepID=UPI001BAA695E|nr:MULTISPECIES: hypothetical protein [unclassified Bradyrhizobium]MBR1220021.1 hypothetical protein [Bradyrhizobium sp. U87765 SZCCT0131]MBR1263523.1 hypothetical protein [Bradyrhizobium sp. U87765 SZCCT0134]MBR1309092.1 hypothetical protein [Bradyrhizobium sp. U87765 SZCCT0110]MBR1323855.1 hypothetical protein [Bradyrhizobium sp. U87765 SZCCT0109]MBR1349407.1 hypothetical protein [Bradyrhizobium sp. U87765 SZCCT0048]
MSYLNRVRLIFFGKFQADMSTVNNDVRHYDNASFLDRYQELQNEKGMNGWWNPTGSGAFRLVDCTVRAVHYEDGTSADTPQQDSVVGTTIAGADNRTSAKLVDIDPQWQLASQLWGLQVRLLDGAGHALVGGEYVPHPFRDLLFSRIAGSGGDGAASAYFQSVLTDLAWGEAGRSSRFIRELKETTQSGKISIRLMTYGFQDAYGQDGFTYGRVSGVIGPYLDGEPESFVRGRRFAPAFGAASWNGINLFTGAVVDDRHRLLLDLANALPLTPDRTLLDIGELSVGALLNENTPEGAPVALGSFATIGRIPYRDADWLQKTGGIASFELSRGQRAAVRNGPLALAVTSAAGATPVVAIRETANGQFVGAEPFVLRIDAGGSATVSFYASVYGAPLPAAEIVITQQGELTDLGGNGPLNPPVPIPIIGIPQKALTLPGAVGADGDGVARMTLLTSPPNNPRGYLDGQMYIINFQIAGQPRQSFGQFEAIAVHLRDAYQVPDSPTWADHISPIFTQYGNLYPIMSRRLVNLNDPASVFAHRKILALAFSLDIGDPNYMPVTRDLSEAKRQTIVKWLGVIDAGGDPAFQALAHAPPSAAPAAPSPPAPPGHEVSAGEGGKTTFARGLARARGLPEPL